MWQGIIKRIQTLSIVQIAALIAFVPVGVVVWVFQNTFIVPFLLVPIGLSGNTDVLQYSFGHSVDRDMEIWCRFCRWYQRESDFCHCIVYHYNFRFRL